MQEEQPLLTEAFSAARRTFLKVLTGIITLVTGFILGIPFLSSLIAPRVKTERQDWNRLGDVNSLPINQPVKLNFFVRTTDAYRHETTFQSVWALKHSSSEVTVYSPICTHLGCYYKWNAGTGHFECPCHASVFSIDGKVLSGPAPRSLDTLPAKIENGVLFIVWKRYEVGRPEKMQG
jgi:quinol---cytochrome c reductase iron-sulfur subunit, bacillus type